MILIYCANCLVDKPRKRKVTKKTRKRRKFAVTDVGSDCALASVTKRCQLSDMDAISNKILDCKSAIKV